MFLRLSVILFTGGGVHPQTDIPPGRPSWADTPRQTPPPGRLTLGRHIPPGRHPPRQTVPRDDHCSGRYASYWNAFLYSCYVVYILINHLMISGTCPCLNVKVQSFSDYVFAHVLKIRSRKHVFGLISHI